MLSTPSRKPPPTGTRTGIPLCGAGGGATSRAVSPASPFCQEPPDLPDEPLSEAMKAEEPALALDAIEERVPLHGFAHAGDGAHDERVEAAPKIAFQPG